MQNIFQALRTLKRAHPDLLLTTDEGSRLRDTLFRFDRANRGHAHHIPQLAALAMQEYPRSDDDQLRTRWWTFRYSMQDLMTALPNTPKAAIPADGAFQALWNAKDDTGCLQHFALQYMRGFIMQDIARPERLWMHSAKAEIDGDRIILTATLQHIQHRTLMATRSMTMPFGGLDSLGACSATLRDFRRKAPELLAGAADWPEFSAGKQQEIIAQRCRSRLQEMLRGCSEEERKYIADNWPQMQPNKLPSGRMATY